MATRALFAALMVPDSAPFPSEPWLPSLFSASVFPVPLLRDTTQPRSDGVGDPQAVPGARRLRMAVLPALTLMGS
jgi:hypothetical protein